MNVSEIMSKGTNTYLAWVARKGQTDNRDLIEALMKQAMNSRETDEVNAIEQYANSLLAELYVNGKEDICFTADEQRYVNVTVVLRTIKNGSWHDFNQRLLNKMRNSLDMLNGSLNRLCVSRSDSERRNCLTSALFYIRDIIDISRERALEAQYGPKAEREANLRIPF